MNGKVFDALFLILSLVYAWYTHANFPSKPQDRKRALSIVALGIGGVLMFRWYGHQALETGTFECGLRYHRHICRADEFPLSFGYQIAMTILATAITLGICLRTLLVLCLAPATATPDACAAEEPRCPYCEFRIDPSWLMFVWPERLVPRVTCPYCKLECEVDSLSTAVGAVVGFLTFIAWCYAMNNFQPYLLDTYILVLKMFGGGAILLFVRAFLIARLVKFKPLD